MSLMHCFETVSNLIFSFSFFFSCMIDVGLFILFYFFPIVCDFSFSLLNIYIYVNIFRDFFDTCPFPCSSFAQDCLTFN